MGDQTYEGYSVTFSIVSATSVRLILAKASNKYRTPINPTVSRRWLVLASRATKLSTTCGRRFNGVTSSQSAVANAVGVPSPYTFPIGSKNESWYCCFKAGSIASNFSASAVRPVPRAISAASIMFCTTIAAAVILDRVRTKGGPVVVSSNRPGGGYAGFQSPHSASVDNKQTEVEGG
jgi:hypothetical protein